MSTIINNLMSKLICVDSLNFLSLRCITYTYICLVSYICHILIHRWLSMELIWHGMFIRFTIHEKKSQSILAVAMVMWWKHKRITTESLWNSYQFDTILWWIICCGWGPNLIVFSEFVSEKASLPPIFQHDKKP
jgi:hypothetical protein